MRKKIFGFSEGAAGEIGEVLNRYRTGFLGSHAPKSRHRENAPRASAADPGYRGYFKVVDVPTADGSPATQIKIIDGANPGGEFCGDTDITPGIPVSVIAKSTLSSVYLIVTRTGPGSFATSFATALPESMTGVAYKELAKIDSDGNIRQLWLNNKIVFRGEYLI